MGVCMAQGERCRSLAQSSHSPMTSPQSQHSCGPLHQLCVQHLCWQPPAVRLLQMCMTWGTPATALRWHGHPCLKLVGPARAARRASNPSSRQHRHHVDQQLLQSSPEQASLRDTCAPATTHPGLLSLAGLHAPEDLLQHAEEACDVTTQLLASLGSVYCSESAMRDLQPLTGVQELLAAEQALQAVMRPARYVQDYHPDPAWRSAAIQAYQQADQVLSVLRQHPQSHHVLEACEEQLRHMVNHKAHVACATGPQHQKAPTQSSSSPSAAAAAAGSSTRGVAHRGPAEDKPDAHVPSTQQSLRQSQWLTAVSHTRQSWHRLQCNEAISTHAAELAVLQQQERQCAAAIRSLVLSPAAAPRLLVTQTQAALLAPALPPDSLWAVQQVTSECTSLDQSITWSSWQYSGSVTTNSPAQPPWCSPQAAELGIVHDSNMVHHSSAPLLRDHGLLPRQLRLFDDVCVSLAVLDQASEAAVEEAAAWVQQAGRGQDTTAGCPRLWVVVLTQQVMTSLIRDHVNEGVRWQVHESGVVPLARVMCDALDHLTHLRNRIAQLQGASSHVHALLHGSLLSHPTAAVTFLVELGSALSPFIHDQLQQMSRLARRAGMTVQPASIAQPRRHNQPPPDSLEAALGVQAWDVEYLRRVYLLEAQACATSAAAARGMAPAVPASCIGWQQYMAYFTLGGVVQGACQLVARLFHVVLTPCPLSATDTSFLFTTSTTTSTSTSQASSQVSQQHVGSSLMGRAASHVPPDMHAAQCRVVAGVSRLQSEGVTDACVRAASDSDATAGSGGDDNRSGSHVEGVQLSGDVLLKFTVTDAAHTTTSSPTTSTLTGGAGLGRQQCSTGDVVSDAGGVLGTLYMHFHDHHHEYPFTTLISLPQPHTCHQGAHSRVLTGRARPEHTEDFSQDSSCTTCSRTVVLLRMPMPRPDPAGSPWAEAAAAQQLPSDQPVWAAWEQQCMQRPLNDPLQLSMLLHELGHALQYLLSSKARDVIQHSSRDTQVTAAVATSSCQDLPALPPHLTSAAMWQLEWRECAAHVMERWARSPAALQLISKHARLGTPLPAHDAARAASLAAAAALPGGYLDLWEQVTAALMEQLMYAGLPGAHQGGPTHQGAGLPGAHQGGPTHQGEPTQGNAATAGTAVDKLQGIAPRDINPGNAAACRHISPGNAAACRHIGTSTAQALALAAPMILTGSVHLDDESSSRQDMRNWIDLQRVWHLEQQAVLGGAHWVYVLSRLVAAAVWRTWLEQDHLDPVAGLAVRHLLFESSPASCTLHDAMQRLLRDECCVRACSPEELDAGAHEQTGWLPDLAADCWQDIELAV